MKAGSRAAIFKNAFRIVFIISGLLFLYARIFAQENTSGSVVARDGARMFIATAGEKVFSDTGFYFNSIPVFLNGSNFIAGSFYKGSKIEAAAAGKIYAITPASGSPFSQEARLQQEGFSKRSESIDGLFKEFDGQLVLLEKTLTDADLAEPPAAYGSWVIFFFSGYHLPSIHEPAKVIWNPGKEYLPQTRLWQGCPTIAKTGKRYWFGWFTGGTKEPDKGNYAVISYSGEPGKTLTDPALIVTHPNEKVRVMDTQLWTDPSGKLWLMWTQNTGINGFDGLWGTWASVCDNPEAAVPEFSKPRRLCDGLTRNKPVVLSTGEWLLPSYTWVDRRSTVYISGDQGRTWTLQGGPYNNNITFYEHMLTEKKDGTVWMMQRSIKESFSTDKGKTWTELKERADFPSPSSRLYFGRLKSGALILIYNRDEERKDRKNMTVALSQDDGKTWPYSLLLDERSGISYPDLVQDDKGRILLVYDRSRTGEKEILMARFSEKEVRKGKIFLKDSGSKILLSRPEIVNTVSK